MLTRQEKLQRIFPFLQWWPMVNRKTLRADLLAGLTGAIIVLPQGIAFAMIAGLPPVYGLYSAIAIPIVAALFGSSFHLISGPTTAISLVLFASVGSLAEPGSPEFIRLVFVVTFLAGVFQLALGIARLGVLANFVSHTVVVGFTAGAAILIFTSQLKYVLGISIPQQSEFLDTWVAIIRNLYQTNFRVLAVALGTLAVALGVRRLSRKLPHLLIAMIVGSGLALLLGGEAVGIRFVGRMPSQLPPFDPPQLSIAMVKRLATNAFAVALLGLIQTLTLARVIATKSHQRIDSNQEFIGQGLSNIIGSFFSSYAGSGSLTRSGVNYDAGAKTPMAAVFSSILLAGILLLVAPLAAYLPMPSMGGIILLVAINLIDIPQIRGIIRVSRREIAVLAVTFFATLFLELEFAIYIGVFLSLIFYLQRTSKPHIAVMAADPEQNNRFINIVRKPSLVECPQLKVVRIDGSLYYGAVDHVAGFLQEITEKCPQRHLLIIANGINFIDLTAAEYLVQEALRWRSLGGDLYIVGLKVIAQDVLMEGGYRDRIGADHFFATKKEAIHQIYQRLDPAVCAECRARLFEECRLLGEKWQESREQPEGEV